MTAIDIPALTEPRRDGRGRYLVMPPGGDRPRGWTRVTTVAKALYSGGGLANWKATMAATGMLMRPGLRTRWEELLAKYGDPWYAGDEAKKACKQLVEECATVGGANDRKEIGSALHTLTALIDLGQKPSHLSDENKADLRAYWRGLRERRIKVVPNMVEVTVVLDDYEIAGTFDRLVTAPSYKLPLVADLKTGGNLEYSWQTIAVQLAAYSRANAIYRQGPHPNGSQDERLPMPAVDQDYGLIMWVPAGEARLELWLVDLNAGWLAFKHSMWTRRWRGSHPEVRFNEQPYIDPDRNLETLLEESIRQRQQVNGAATAPVVDLFASQTQNNKQGE